MVITDGQSIDSARTLAAAENARLNNIGLIAVGVGSNVNNLELQNIANDPDSNYVFKVNNYRDLQSMSTTILNAACTSKLMLMLYMLFELPQLISFLAEHMLRYLFSFIKEVCLQFCHF